MLLVCSRSARDHGSRAVPESSTINHQDVDEQEEYQKYGAEEMNGACGLLAAKHRHSGRKRGRDGGRHRQARPDHQGEQNEDHEQVGDALKHVIGPRFCFTRWLEAQMVR